MTRRVGATWSVAGDHATPSEEIVYQLDGGRITGSGPISDFNGVAIPFGETREMTFEASCG